LYASGPNGLGNQAFDTLVVGGGVEGLATALAFADRGSRVAVLDAARLRGPSSRAGGGILSPLYPWTHDPSVNRLAWRSQGLYPDLCRTIQAETGVDPELRRTGMLYVDFPSHPPVDYEAAQAWAEAHGVRLEELEGEATLEREPLLSPLASGSLFMPEVAWVRNPRLMGGMLRLAQERGVQVLDGVTVLGLESEGDLVRGVRTDVGALEGERTIVAAGAWSGALLAQSLGEELPVYPVKGEMLLLQADRPLLSGVVMAGSHYLIPRADNRILVGSTVKDRGFDARPSLGGVRSLSQAAVEMVPDTAVLKMEDYWAGLRPGSPDGRPFIGSLAGWRGLYVNTGHFRNGLAQAPASAELLAAQAAGETPVLDPEPFSPDRVVEPSEIQGYPAPGTHPD
jgi:glycine oxidase